MTAPLQSLQKRVATFFDGIAMYRTVTLALLSLAACSLYLGAVGDLPYTFTEQLTTLVALITVGYVINASISLISGIPGNHESAVITALIIFFLFIPPASFSELYIPLLALVAAIVSKFVLVYKRQHIFNAAAVGAVAVSWLGLQDAWWWVAQPELFAPLVLAGVIVVHKVRRFEMVSMFILVGMLVVLLESLFILNTPVPEALYRYIVTGPALFLGFFMLTEPFTTPGRRVEQLTYAAIVAVLVNTTLLAYWFPVSPELALLMGNLVVWPWLLRRKLYFVLESKAEIAKNTYEFIFKKPDGLSFIAGQYLEWMLPHKHNDQRGIRRYFTIASAPSEEHVKLGVRISPERGSSFKRALVALKPGETVVASQRAGDFSLAPTEPKGYGFIAGGIGITPFISILTERAHTHTPSAAPVTLFYANNTYDEIAYRETLDALKAKQPLNVVHVLAKEQREGYAYGLLTKELIVSSTPDVKEREWYLSGPPGMVNAYRTLLRELGVPRNAIVTDYFPGLA